MIKVLDLFAGTQSVRKALELTGEEFEYKGIDIYSPEEENIILDLSQDNIVEAITEKLAGWKPDIIWASPICNWFSTALNAKGGGNFYYEIDKNGIPFPRENWNINIRNYMEKYLIPNDKGITPAKERAILGLKFIENTTKIIKNYNSIFAIENPAHNYAKPVYLAKGLIPNRVAYCNYGFEVRKYTNIYTNKKIDLNDNCNHKFHKYTMGKKVHPDQISYSGYANRSAVPPKLIIEIFKQLKEGQND